MKLKTAEIAEILSQTEYVSYADESKRLLVDIKLPDGTKIEKVHVYANDPVKDTVEMEIRKLVNYKRKTESNHTMNKPTVTQEQVDKIIEDSEITVETVHEKITRVTCKLPNGWVECECTGAVSKENYDEDIGRDICMRKIESKIWQMEGYRLQANLAEASKDFGGAEHSREDGERIKEPFLFSSNMGKCDAFSDAHSIADIVRYAIKQAGGSTAEIQCILDIEAVKSGQEPSIGYILHLIREWGESKGITGPNAKATVKTQFEKLLEEVEELREGIEKESFDEIEDAIGDCVVVLTLLSELTPQPTDTGESPMVFTVEKAIRAAYEIISKRTGKMVDGKFVKDALFDPTPFLGNLAIALAPEDFTFENIVEVVAKECHEANRRYCASIDDFPLPAWEDAPDWQRRSAINGVKFHCDNPGASASASHENWLKEKADDGWKYGPKKDPEKKEHPCFVPYGRLPQEQRNKDTLFISVIGQYREDLLKAQVGY